MSAAETFNSKSRLEAIFNRQPVDRPPALSGWLLAPNTIMELTGKTEDEYWDDPVGVTLQAYKKFNLDGLVDVAVPSQRGEFRNVSKEMFDDRASKYQSPEDVVAEIEKLPSPEEERANFDEEAFYTETVSKMKEMQRLCAPEIFWCPTRWEVVPRWEWYEVFGYENYMMAMKLYPDTVDRLLQHSAAVAGCKAKVIARMITEGIQPKAFLCGKDICGQQGPMVNPDYLREHWFPLVKEAFQPLFEVDAQIVWHCDGYIPPILDDILNLGVAGLQGFQTESGFRFEDIVERKTIRGEKLIIFGPISVTTTLVNGTPEDVKTAVRQAVKICEGKAHLAIMTSNAIGPDVLVENIFAMYDVLEEL